MVMAMSAALRATTRKRLATAADRDFAAGVLREIAEDGTVAAATRVEAAWALLCLLEREGR